MAEPTPVDASAVPYRAPWRPPQPRMPLWPLLPSIVGALVAVFALSFTTNKLLVMARLRGDIEGIEGRPAVLLGEVRRFNEAAADYALGDAFTREPLGYTIQLREHQAVRYRSGNALFVRCLEDEGSCYIRGSIYIDDANRSFDLALLCIELCGLGVALWAMTRRLRAWRGAIRPVSGKIEAR